MCYNDPMPSRSSPLLKWILAVKKAAKNKDANRLLELERERLAGEAATPLSGGGVLRIATYLLDEWAVDVALGWDTPKPAVDVVLFHLVKEEPEKTRDNRDLGKRLAWKMMAFASPAHLESFWDGELCALPGTRWLTIPASWFIDLGVDVAQLRPMFGSIFGPVKQDSFLRSLPEPYGQLCGRALEAGAPACWSPLMACFLHDNPDRAFELIGVGLDPWACESGSVLPHWSLAGALGLDPTNTQCPGVETSDGEDVRHSQAWAAVRSAVLEKKLSTDLAQVSEPVPSRPRF